ncbi:hypothetical protein TTHERM_000621229 (macronuclear) [Tetrahymena thermophila SB210]|uniref:Uncharacterized protein n=1 Tax=Tetrahymena thermophila (strain SB210) TaxID=312017 RepID=W7XJ79_TETTS|nr:hypothetical protein TTHERM_000621229 [Tetrahymena thermophila SB210]EWS73929.1 hypothetical protein TTHERM_000621229 [Tetrahymena thermophila SB210]|eukprot:XP_012653551.1 hypothetical protein TTHERM_000621229 [Tetrahymena thermophila SB210]
MAFKVLFGFINYKILNVNQHKVKIIFQLHEYKKYKLKILISQSQLFIQIVGKKYTIYSEQSEQIQSKFYSQFQQSCSQVWGSQSKSRKQNIFYVFQLEQVNKYLLMYVNWQVVFNQ